MALEQLKFPIGQFTAPTKYNKEQRNNAIETIANFPNELEQLISGLKNEELNWIYRQNGWSIQQVVHHCADSHMNSFIRFKLGLTEDAPTIKPYYEDRWATLADYQVENIPDALLLIKGLHLKWVVLLNSIAEAEYEKSFVHPEHGKSISLQENLLFYQWHCKHHLAHIQQAINYKGIF